MNIKEFINLIEPEHSRTSCSDKEIFNGVNEVDIYARCGRCALLDLMNNPEKIELVDTDSTYFNCKLKG